MVLNAQDTPSYFPYPPYAAFLLVPLAWLGIEAAAFAWLLANLAALALIVWLTLERIREHAKTESAQAERLVAAALIIANPFTIRTVWLGQTSLIVLAAIMAAWELMRRRKPVAAGICLAVAAIKPQAAALVAIWWLLERRWLAVGTAAVAATLMSIYPAVAQGALESLRSWRMAVEVYGAEAPNVGSYQYVVTLQGLLQSIGFQVPSLAPLAVALTLVLWTLRQRIPTDSLLGLLLGLGVTFMYAHDQDLVWLIPLATTLWLQARYDPRRTLLLAVMLALVMTPLRLLRVLHLGGLYHWRTAVVLVMMGMAVRWGWTREPRRLGAVSQRQASPSY
jgi:hypothetical protein